MVKLRDFLSSVAAPRAGELLSLLKKLFPGINVGLGVSALWPCCFVGTSPVLWVCSSCSAGVLTVVRDLFILLLLRTG